MNGPACGEERGVSFIGRGVAMSAAGRISRRRFMGVAATAAGAAALSPRAALANGGHDPGHGHDHGGGGGGGGIVPRDRLGVQQWSLRDAITRLDGSIQGYLGGRNFPADPKD